MEFKIITELLKKHDLPPTKQPVPDTLYHYTTRQGLLGIVQSKRIWATDIRYLNDAAEFEVAARIFKTVSEEFLNQLTASNEKQFVEELKRWILGDSPVEDIPHPHQVFVFSMSEHRDSLSQWRAYTKPGDAYAVGLSTKELSEHVGKHGFVFLSCEYDQAEQTRIVRSFVLAGLELVRSYGQSANSEVLAANWFSAFLIMAPMLKDPAFSEEREWRLVAPFWNPAPGNIKFRAGKTVLVPYVELPLERESGGCPIAHVVVGPSPHKWLDALAVVNFYRLNDTALIGALPSSIPFREI